MLRNLITCIHCHFWVRRATQILMRRPFSWTKASAAPFAAALYHLYLEEGFSPAEAVECDRQYWGG